MNLTPAQLKVRDGILAYCTMDNPPPYCSLRGLAGSGKSTIIADIRANLPSHLTAAYAAPTGKACARLRAAGVPASTIHSTIYDTVLNPDGTFTFNLKTIVPFDILFVDEASMVTADQYADLIRLGVRLVFVGDHGQLEPVDSNFNLLSEADFTLEEIHRQALDNPIIRFAHYVREGNNPTTFVSPDPSRLLITRRSNPQFDFSYQFICAFNKTRVALNKAMRRALSLDHSLLTPGERLICLRNSKRFNIFNGQSFNLVSIDDDTAKFSILCKLQPADFPDSIQTLPLHRATLETSTLPAPADLARIHSAAFFDYSYCLTAHKSQGSEWDNVAVIYEPCNKWSNARWAYTAITRASRNLHFYF